MLMDDKVNDLRHGAFNHIQAILDLERFVKVMTPEELIEYEKMITCHKTPIFSKSIRAKWIEKLHEKEQVGATAPSAKTILELSLIDKK